MFSTKIKPNLIEIDLNNIEDTADKLNKISPNIIINTATLLPWWYSECLPENKKIYAKNLPLGITLPNQLFLIKNLLKSLSISLNRKDYFIINCAYPDVVNHLLNKLNLCPDIGIGNLSNCVPAIEESISLITEIPSNEIDVQLYAHHSFSYSVSRKGKEIDTPFYIETLNNGKLLDISYFDVFDNLNKSLARTTGISGTQMTACSA